MSAAPQPKQAAAPRTNRMTLGAVVKGRLEQPTRAMIYGPEGVGKTTFGANAPNPIFLGAEDGTAQLDAVRFPAPESWADILDAIQTLTVDQHDYKTLVIDTLDWAEPMLWAHICKRDEKKDIEDYGYGKGYAAALDEWRVFLGALERLRKARGMHVVLVAHSWLKPFKNPEGEDFDRYELKLHPKAGGLLKEWCDAVLFANYETAAKVDKKTKRVRGVDTGMRLVHTERRAAYDAKNRYSLPETLPLSWADFEAAVRAHAPADVSNLTSEVERKAKALGGEREKECLAALGRAKGDAVKLAFLNNWANARLAEKEENNE
jgi:hypothetical protein